MDSNDAKESCASERRFLQLLDALPNVSVQGYDKHRRVIYWNRSSTDIYGYSKEEALGQTLEDLIIPDEMKAQVIQSHKNWVEQGAPIPATELVLKRKDGCFIPVFSSHVMLKEYTQSPEMFCIDVDLSEQYSAREELRVIATTDLLTGLPNRRYLEDELIRIVEESQLTKGAFAIFFIDLDMFKEVNDTLGHTWGDRLLNRVAQRMLASLSSDHTLTRFGGDEFVLVMPDVTAAADMEAVALRLLEQFKDGFSLDSENIFITASIGISRYPQDGQTAEELLKYADAAMYFAKESGRNTFRFFTPELKSRLEDLRDISSRLHQSLQKDEFELLYQPQFNMKTREIIACEALIRWHPSEGGTVPPGVFIPIAERSDLILRIGEWVLKQACAQISAWKQAGINLRVDINVSGKQLEQVNFFSMLDGYRQHYHLSPQDLGIELTEHVLIKSNERILSGLKAERAKGVDISIDDFGTGYSSLNYLKVFPLTHLKIDRAFVLEAPENELDGALLEAIINIGHKLKLNIVIEGVETVQQAQFCLDLHSDYAQGYWYSKPVTADKIGELYHHSFLE